MNKFSLTYQGITISLLAWFINEYGTAISNEEVESFVKIGIILLGAIITAYGRYRAGGVSVFGLRK